LPRENAFGGLEEWLVVVPELGGDVVNYQDSEFSELN